ncbi:MAG: MFS transporter [Lautropia sp.]|nr:MFS transporter [Lautropia sp.]
MTTIVVARKGRSIAIAADSLISFGETRYSSDDDTQQKIIGIGDSLIGMSGSAAHFDVLKRVLSSMEKPCFRSRDAIFDTFLHAHSVLKEKYFLNTKEEDDDPYESSQITALIANTSGVYGVYSYREVFEFDRFWAIGSGRNYALGAMHAVWDSAKNATTVAEAGVRAGIEFDKSSGGSVRTHTLKIR